MNRLIFISCIVVLLSLAVVEAPSFLLVSDQPVKSDAVVLFLGGEKGTREKEAHQLIRDGFADYLIIPAYRQIKKQGPDGKLIRLDLALPASSSDQRTNELTNQRTSSSLNTPRQRLNQQTSSSTSSSNQLNQQNQPNQRNWLFEDTHEEAVIARDMMESLGIRSSILVSSPYHMRRIKMIAEKVFGDGLTVNFVPTRYETPSDGFWLFNNYDRRFVMNEYIKIAWFVLYSPFV